MTRAEVQNAILADARVAAFVKEQKYSDSFARLFVASIPTLTLPTRLSECTFHQLVVNEAIDDIKATCDEDNKDLLERNERAEREGTLDPDTAGLQSNTKIKPPEMLETIRLRIERRVRDQANIGPKTELTVDQERSVVTYLRRCYMTYAFVQGPNADTPPFVVFLTYNGKSKGAKDNDLNNIDNYTPINLTLLDMFHPPGIDRRELVEKEISAVDITAVTIRKKDGSEFEYKTPLYDPRWLINYHKKAAKNKAAVKLITALFATYKPRLVPDVKKRRPKERKKKATKEAPDKDASESSSSSEDAAKMRKEEKKNKKKKKEKEKEEKKKEKKKRPTNEADKKEKKKAARPPKQLPPATVAEDAPQPPATAASTVAPSPAPAGAVVHALNPRVAAADPLVYDPVRRPYVVSNPTTLAALGVPALDRNDIADLHFWVDKLAQAGYDPLPTIAELHALVVHANQLHPARQSGPPTAALSGSLLVRVILCLLGLYNRSFYRAPFVNIAATNEPPLAVLGTVDAERLTEYLTPNLISAGKDATLRTALIRETVKLIASITSAALSAPVV
jgi:hypothetical protein